MPGPYQRNIPVSQKKKDECNARAQEIVLNLIDGAEDEGAFFHQLQWINQNHYQDVVEERSIMKLCGYPLCYQKLGIVPKKRYHISVTENKVYDITERKMFCSNNCYKASSYLKEQIFTSPLWFRDPEDVPKFTLLKCKTGSLGEEIDFGIERVEIPRDSQASKDETKCKKTDTDDSGRQFQSSNSLQGERVASGNENKKTKIETDEASEQSRIQNSPRDMVTKDSDQRHETEKRSTNKLQVKTVENSHLTDQEVYTSVSSVTGSDVSKLNTEGSAVLDEFAPSGQVHQSTAAEQLKSRNSSSRKPAKSVSNSIIKVHVTEEQDDSSDDVEHHLKSVELIKTQLDSEAKLQQRELRKPKKVPVKSPGELILRVEQCLHEWLTVDSLCRILGSETVTQLMREKGKTFGTSDCIKSDPLMYERYTAICRKLKILEIEEDKYEKETVGFEAPTKPLPDYATLKEQTKEMEIKVRSFYQGDRKVSFAEEEPKDEDAQERPIILPPLQQYAKNTLRRNMVLDRLKVVLPDLCQVMGLHYLDISGKVKELLLTCRFSAHNITFKPLEWNLIGLVLLKLLSVKDEVVQCRLRGKAKYINTLLMSYHLENNYLDLLCTWLTDIDQVLSNESSDTNS